MQVVASLRSDGVLGPIWKCDLCECQYAFLSVMIAHLFTEHSVRALSQSEERAELVGIVNPEQ